MSLRCLVIFYCLLLLLSVIVSFGAYCIVVGLDTGFMHVFYSYITHFVLLPVVLCSEDVTMKVNVFLFSILRSVFPIFYLFVKLSGCVAATCCSFIFF